MDARDQLLHLLKIQEIVDRVREARAVIDAAPGRIEEIEARFRERNAEYVAVKERYDLLQTDQRQRSAELATLEESRKKYMDDLMQVKNQREYAAMLKEIDTVKARISEHEEAILKDMEEIDTLKGDLDSRTSHIDSEREIVGKERGEVDAEVADAEAVIRERGDERRSLESELPNDLVALVARIEESRQGLFLARADAGVCQACFVRIRPQAFQEIKLAARIHACPNCRRLLYYPGLVRNDPESAPSSDHGTTGLEAMNGGTV